MSLRWTSLEGLNIGTVPMLCILNVGTVPTFSPSQLALSQGLLFDEWVDHVVKELNVEDALKLSILAAAPKNGVEFCQGSDGTIRISLATSYDVLRRRVCVWELF